MEFTEPKISTMALIGQIFTEEYLSEKPPKLDLYEICNMIDLSKHPKLLYVEFKSDVKSISKGRCGETDEDPDSKGFANSASFVIELEKDRKPIKLKLSTNGSLQLPGFKTTAEIDTFIEIFKTIVKDISLIPEKYTNIRIISVSMIKYDLSLKNEFVYLDSGRLANYIIENTKMFVSYEGIESRSAEIQFTNENGESIDGYPFWSFKINLTSVKSIETVQSSYKYITEFLITNIKEFVMLDNLTNLFLTLETCQCRGDQKSEEWDDFRSKTIGASEVSSIFGMGYSKSRSALIKEKIELRATKKKTFFGNAATRHGETFEPIAIQIYTRYWNHSGKKPVNIFSMQVSSIIHNKYPYISASPDSIIFTTEEKVSYKDKWTLEKVKEYARAGKITGFFTLEIKCPSNYKTYSGDMTKMIECTNGYVPSYYWCQMQQQMYVTGANHGVFMNNHFVEYSETEYDIDCQMGAKNWRGVILKVYAEEYSKTPVITYYPEDVLAKKADAIIELREKAAEHEGKILRYSYWKLVTFVMTDVEFCPEWESEYVPKITECEKEISEGLRLRSDIDLE